MGKREHLKLDRDLAYMRVVLHSSYQKISTFCWPDQTNDTEDHKRTRLIRRASILSLVSVRWMAHQDYHN